MVTGTNKAWNSIQREHSTLAPNYNALTLDGVLSAFLFTSLIVLTRLGIKSMSRAIQAYKYLGGELMAIFF
jgi:hypothetical protein